MEMMELEGHYFAIITVTESGGNHGVKAAGGQDHHTASEEHFLLIY